MYVITIQEKDSICSVLNETKKEDHKSFVLWSSFEFIRNIMKTLFINLAGCVVKMQLMNDITISEKLQPFLCEEIPSHADIVLDVRNCIQLPNPEEDGSWEGSNYYVYHGKELRVFHVNEVGSSPFSVTCFQEDGNISLLYLKEYEHYFVGSSGIFNKIGAEQLLLQQNRLLLHASFVTYCGKGILFSGPSGSGKSTQAELWKHTMGAEIINGDRAAVGLSDKGWTAWGIPYAGTSGICHNASAPLLAIVVLKKAKENRIRKLSPIEALRYMYPEITTHQWDAKFVEKVIFLLTKLISDVPVLLLECLPDESAVASLQEELTRFS